MSFEKLKKLATVTIILVGIFYLPLQFIAFSLVLIVADKK